MIDSAKEKCMIAETEKALGVRIVETFEPRQGMGSSVLVAADDRGRQMAIKCGAEVESDVRALDLLRKNRIEVPVPEVLASFALGGETVLVMEKIDRPLLEDVLTADKHRYLTSMVANLKKIHAIKSDVAGPLSPSAGKTWKEFLLYKYGGTHPWFDWSEIFQRALVDGELLRSAIAKISSKISGAELINSDYSFLHTDFNQRNLFVDPSTHEIAAVIDWSEAMFGDPLYDFARVRMFIFHFNLGEAALGAYFEALELTEEEKKREEIYFVSQIIDYVAWYSQSRNSFNDGRLKLHQDFLRGGEW